MKVHGMVKLDEFRRRHPVARSWVNAWIADAKGASWSAPQDIKLRYSSASFLAGNVVIFNVKGRDYRLVTQVAYKMGVVVIKWIGPHSEYDKMTWEGAQNEASSR
jgi:mRNA interferase HigB